MRFPSCALTKHHRNHAAMSSVENFRDSGQARELIIGTHLMSYSKSCYERQKRRAFNACGAKVEGREVGGRAPHLPEDLGDEMRSTSISICQKTNIRIRLDRPVFLCLFILNLFVLLLLLPPPLSLSLSLSHLHNVGRWVSDLRQPKLGLPSKDIIHFIT